MKRTLFGVIGHVDHGKTALVRVLTGIDTDRLPEEKRRGISIALGFAHFLGKDAVIDLIDMPGHERFVRTMISGATGLDAVLLVVAANEGIKPQTIEHLDIAALVGVRRAVIAVTKADLVDAETLAAARGSVARLVAKAGLETGAPITTSATMGTGIEELRNALLACAEAHVTRDDGFAWLPVDRAFSVPGFGTVATGTLHRGALSVGDELSLIPGGPIARVRGLQVHRLAVARAVPGSRVAVNLRGVGTSALGRGQALVTPGVLKPAIWLNSLLHVVESAPGPIQTGARLKLLFGTTEVEARLRLLDRDALTPGETAPAQLRSAAPVTLPSGERCVLRTVSPPRTVAGGRVLEATSQRLRRNDAAVIARLLRLADSDQEAVIAGELEEAGGRGVALEDLARVAGLSPSRVTKHLPRLRACLAKGQVAVRLEVLSAVMTGVLGALARTRTPSTIEGLHRLLPGPLGLPVLEEALHRLVARGGLRQSGGTWHLARPEQERHQRQLDAELAQRLAELLRTAGLSPPGPDEILAAHPGARRALDGLRRSGELVLTFDRVQKRQFLFHREAVAEARRRLAPLLAKPPGILVKEAGAVLGISRKYSVPLLEYFDAVQYTRRHGDRRMLLHPEDG
jgi:selenocysteine-specific elongation factor